MEDKTKTIELQRERERQIELDRLHTERHWMDDNRAARRSQAAIDRALDKVRKRRVKPS